MEIALFLFIGLILLGIFSLSYYGESSQLFNNSEDSIMDELKSDLISEIGIDEQSRLYIKPKSAKFPYIYREAMEVHWDEDECFLYSPKPRDWFYLDWFKQITKAAESQSTRLIINDDTKWVNVPNEIKQKLVDAGYSKGG